MLDWGKYPLGNWNAQNRPIFLGERNILFKIKLCPPYYYQKSNFASDLGLGKRTDIHFTNLAHSMKLYIFELIGKNGVTCPRYDKLLTYFILISATAIIFFFQSNNFSSAWSRATRKRPSYSC